jgi:hypothetical protein
MRLISINFIESDFEVLIEWFKAANAFGWSNCTELTLEQQTLRCTRDVHLSMKISDIKIRGKVYFGKVEMDVSITPDRQVVKESDIDL